MRTPSTQPIRSAANPILREVRAVAAGKRPGWILLEGDRLVEEAARRGVALEHVLVPAGREVPRAGDGGALRGPAVREVDPDLLRRAGTLKTPRGSLALARSPGRVELESLEAGELALVVVAGGVQDPGNLGALARAAEAAGAEALVVVGGGASPDHPRALRGSMGSLLTLPVAPARDAAAASEALAAAGFRQVVASARGGEPHRSFDWSGPIALWIASESGRIPGADLPAGAPPFERVSIPMAGGVESLNLTAAAAVLLFSAGRGAGPRARREEPS